jgi:glycosyltransferase involved in cell wall biosynthesis
VIVAVRDGERFLADALASIEAQHRKPSEVLVVEGRSTDRTREIALASPLVRIVEQQNDGIADAYNLGIDAARGDLVTFLSHDDEWTPEKLELQARHLASDPDLQVSVARVSFFLEAGCPIPEGFRRELLEGSHPGYIMETMVARRGVFEQVGPFDTSLPFGEDTDWFSRAIDLGVPMAMLDQTLLHKRIHDENSSVKPSASRSIMFEVLKRSIARKRTRD